MIALDVGVSDGVVQAVAGRLVVGSLAVSVGAARLIVTHRATDSVQTIAGFVVGAVFVVLTKSSDA